MIGVVGDLVEDIVVELGGPVNLASDTDAVVSRRRGGSAANVAVAAAAVGARARFIGSIGDDPLGDALALRLREAGVEVRGRRSGRTGTIIVLVDDGGERTMLSDRGSSSELAEPDPSWLDGLLALHVPFYSLAVEPMATTCRTLIAWARTRDILVSLDVSSTAVVEGFGIDRFRRRITDLAADIVFANEAEADLVGIEAMVESVSAPSGQVVVHDAAMASVHRSTGTAEVAGHDLGPVLDSTGAGDAFAGGFLSAIVAGADSVSAASRGHDAARDHLLRVHSS